MANKVIIDIDKCNKEGIPLDAVLYMLSLKIGTPINSETQHYCSQNRLIVTEESNLYKAILKARITLDGIEFVNNALEQSDYTPIDSFEEMADKMRNLFPKGKKPGTNYMWRDSVAIIAKRLKAVQRKYKEVHGCEFTQEQAINATKAYVESFNGDYRYMQLLKYFISKAVVVNGVVEESSQLMSYIENEGPDNNPDRDWTSTLI